MLNRRQFLSAAVAGAGAAMFARGPRAFAASYDLIIKGGRVIDPSVRLDAIRDVAELNRRSMLGCFPLVRAQQATERRCGSVAPFPPSGGEPIVSVAQTMVRGTTGLRHAVGEKRLSDCGQSADLTR